MDACRRRGKRALRSWPSRRKIQCYDQRLTRAARFQQSIDKRRQEGGRPARNHGKTAQTFGKVISQKREVGRKNSNEARPRPADPSADIVAGNSWRARASRPRTSRPELQGRGEASKAEKAGPVEVSATPTPKRTKRTDERPGKGRIRRSSSTGGPPRGPSRADDPRKGSGRAISSGKESGAGGDKMPGQGLPTTQAQNITYRQKD